MSSEFPAPQRVSPRRRFHRPAAESLGARRQVPVLTGLPRVEEKPKRAELEITETVDSGQQTTEFESPIAPAAGLDEKQPANQQPVAPELVTGSPPNISEARKVARAAASARSREWVYPVAGTLVAGLLIYIAVFGLKPQTRELRGSQTAGWHESTPNDHSASAPVAQIARAVPKTGDPESPLEAETPAAAENARVSLETAVQPLDEPLEQPLEPQLGQPIGERIEQREDRATLEPSANVRDETQIPWRATESVDSVTSAPAILSDVIAPAPAHETPAAEAPSREMPAEARTPVYPTTNFSEELPEPQVIPRPQTEPRTQTILTGIQMPGIQPTAAAGPALAPPRSPLGFMSQPHTHGQRSVPGKPHVQGLGQPPLGPVSSQPHMPNYAPLAPGLYVPGQEASEQVRLNGSIEPFPMMKR